MSTVCNGRAHEYLRAGRGVGVRRRRAGAASDLRGRSFPNTNSILTESRQVRPSVEILHAIVHSTCRHTRTSSGAYPRFCLRLRALSSYPPDGIRSTQERSAAYLRNMHSTHHRAVVEPLDPWNKTRNHKSPIIGNNRYQTLRERSCHAHCQPTTHPSVTFRQTCAVDTPHAHEQLSTCHDYSSVCLFEHALRTCLASGVYHQKPHRHFVALLMT
jgi:hypothetical protein